MNSPPAIQPDGLYTRQQIQANLKLSPQTITGWIDFHGLNPIQPGTRSMFFLGSELIAFMVKNRAGITKPKTMNEKAALRRGAK